MSMFALLSTWWRARVREEKGGRERRTLSPLSRRVTASACYNFLLSLHCHDARSFFFFFLSVPSDKTGLMDHPIYTYTGIWSNLTRWFHLLQFSYNYTAFSISRERKWEIRGSLFPFLFLSRTKKFNFQMSSVDSGNRTYVQFRLRFRRGNGGVHGRHVGAKVMRQLGHVIRAGHSLRYARHARHAGRAGTVGRYARDGGFGCRWRRHRGLRAAVRCQDHGLSIFDPTMYSVRYVPRFIINHLARHCTDSRTDISSLSTFLLLGYHHWPITHY